MRNTPRSASPKGGGAEDQGGTLEPAEKIAADHGQDGDTRHRDGDRRGIDHHEQHRGERRRPGDEAQQPAVMPPQEVERHLEIEAQDQ
jgi:hypothetical protein